MALTIHKTDLYAGTYGAGVWRRPLSEIITDIDDNENKIPSRFILDQNYPNPFNPSTTISFSIPQNSTVSLKVFDLLGKEVAVLVNGYKPAGSYKIEFNTQLTANNQQLSSGVYFYQIQATPVGGQTENFVATKKFILLK